MAKKRLSVRKTKEILRLRLAERRSLREVGRSVHCSPSKVHDVEMRFRASGLTWPLDPELDEGRLEAILYLADPPRSATKALPDWADVHKELRRKGVTLYLLWQEYKQEHPRDGYQYSQFCERYRRYCKKLDVVMRQNHKAGDKAFVDWSGDGIDIVHRETGEVTEAPVVLGVLGASGYSFA